MFHFFVVRDECHNLSIREFSLVLLRGRARKSERRHAKVVLIFEFIIVNILPVTPASLQNVPQNSL